MKAAGHRRAPGLQGSAFQSCGSGRIHRQRGGGAGRCRGRRSESLLFWVSFYSEENVPKLIAVMVTRHCELRN